jgi:hypothetical protein
MLQRLLDKANFAGHSQAAAYVVAPEVWLTVSQALDEVVNRVMCLGTLQALQEVLLVLGLVKVLVDRCPRLLYCA